MKLLAYLRAWWRRGDLASRPCPDSSHGHPCGQWLAVSLEYGGATHIDHDWPPIPFALPPMPDTGNYTNSAGPGGRPSCRGPHLFALAAALALSGCASTARVGQHARPPRPNVALRVSPHFAFTPANVLVTLELVGGEDGEALYCPEIDWNWGDDSRSIHEADCAPWGPGTVLERRMSKWHCYRSSGDYPIVVTLSKAHHKIAVGTGSVSIRWAPQGGSC